MDFRLSGRRMARQSGEHDSHHLRSSKRQRFSSLSSRNMHRNGLHNTREDNDHRTKVPDTRWLCLQEGAAGQQPHSPALLSILTWEISSQTAAEGSPALPGCLGGLPRNAQLCNFLCLVCLLARVRAASVPLHSQLLGYPAPAS